MSQDDLDAWALRAWPKANTLMPADGDEVRQAFQARLTRLQRSGPRTSRQPNRTRHATNETRSRIDKSVLALPEAKRLRDKQHLRFVAKQPCLVCGREPCDAHHLRFAQSRGLGLKVSDEFAVPLCRAHHRELHRAGKEAIGGQNRHRADRYRAQTLARNTSADGLGRLPGGDAGARNGTTRNRRFTAAARAADGETNPVAGHSDMTSLRQIESNRRNAQRSTGPKTKAANSALPRMPFAMD